MSTLDLQQAAALCKKSPATMKRLARDREDVGRFAAKIGKDWVWIEADLLEHIRAQYTAAPCPSTSRRTPRTGTSTSACQVMPAYVNQLDALIGARRKKSMT